MEITKNLENHGAILVVEDEILVRSFLTSFLKDLGYRVLEASFDEDALAQIQNGSEEIDVVLVEASIGRRGGASLMKDVGELKPEIEFLIMSGLSSSSNPAFQQLEEDGRFLSKPFSLELLSQKVHQFMK